MSVSEFIELAISLLELASRAVKLFLAVKEVLLTRRGKERHK